MPPHCIAITTRTFLNLMNFKIITCNPCKYTDYYTDILIKMHCLLKNSKNLICIKIHSVIQNSQVSRHNFVLKDGSRWDIDTLTMISNDYNCAFENNFAFPSKSNISRDCQMIKLQNIRRISNSPKEIIDLEINVLKVVSEFSKFIFNEFYNSSCFFLL